MSSNHLKTKFAPAERATDDELEYQVSLFKNNEILNQFLGIIPAIFIIINKYRQIVYMNQGAIDFTGLEDVALAVGQRPGELMRCIHASEEEGGCGTSEFCTYCGAVNAVLEAQKGIENFKDSRLILENIGAFDLRVWASPLTINEDTFTAVTLQDIQNEKWNNFLQRIFFHDILNTLSGLKGSLELVLNHPDKVDTNIMMKKIEQFTNNLIDEIQSHKLLINAENNELEPTYTTINSKELIKNLVELYNDHPLTEKIPIVYDEASDSIYFTSDLILLRRVLKNMIKNALEATETGDKVTIGCNVKGSKIQFWVHNPGYIPKEIQLQIFKRSFSTKSHDRGLGTYSMKFFSNFLNGDIKFSTSKKEGTTFYAEYPIQITQPTSIT